MTSSVKIRRGVLLACSAVLLGGGLLGPVASAGASDASIKSVIKSYSSRILVAEGHVVSALGEYKKSGDPSGVTSAITASVSVLRSLKSAIRTQIASSPKVKQGKAKFEKGLQKVIVGYQHLKTAFGEKKARPQAAKQQAAIALNSLKRAKKELNEGAKLLR
jgi:predicted acyltransferase